MSDNNEIEFFIADEKTHYDQIFERIKKIPSTWWPKKISRFIAKELSLTVIIIRPLPPENALSLPLFRLRVLKENESIDENDWTEFRYPPRKYCSLGRANRNRQQVLYLSNDPHTTVYELQQNVVTKESICYLSSWGIKDLKSPVNMNSIFHGIEENETSYASIMAKGIQELMDITVEKIPETHGENFQYYHTLFRKLFTSEDKSLYHITSSIAYDSMILAKKQNPPVDMPILVYPSVAKDSRAVNYAIRKDFVDEFMYIKHVDKVIINKISDDNINIIPISRGFVSVSNVIHWKTPELHIEHVNYDKAYLSIIDSPTKVIEVISKYTDVILENKRKISIFELLQGTPHLKEENLRSSILKQPQQMSLIEETKGNSFFVAVNLPNCSLANTGKQIKYLGIKVDTRILYV